MDSALVALAAPPTPTATPFDAIVLAGGRPTPLSSGGGLVGALPVPGGRWVVGDLRDVRPGGAISVTAVNARGLASWDWATVVAPD